MSVFFFLCILCIETTTVHQKDLHYGKLENGDFLFIYIYFLASYLWPVVVATAFSL